MCGIYGSTFPYKEDEVKSKLERTKFRGPDKMGWRYFDSADRQVIFGHNRLSIIDLDARSDQPFTYNDKIHIVFNGEIYNFQKVKSQLAQKGYSFNTTSDTEVICAAYLEFGESCVEHFNGMFAFVIYDEVNQILFGAKDRLGQKPFYYFHNGTHFEFASQLSSIQLFNDNLTISKQAIQYYLSWNSIPYPHSIFNEVKILRDGHTFKYDLQSGKLEDRPYWDIDFQGKNAFAGTYEEAQDELEAILTDATKIRLFADVPVGVFLSGGIDSSLITALATKNTMEKVKTFSVKFDDEGFDESIHAKKVADYLKTDHHIIECRYKEGMDLIDDFCYYYDEPFADSSAIPSMLLSKYTRQHVTVALSGDGGDESFLGYHRYNWLKYLDIIMKFPKPLRLLAAKTLKVAPHYRLKVIGYVIKANTIEEAYSSVMFNPNTSWLKSQSHPSDLEEYKYLMHKHKNIFEKASDFDVKTYLNWDINVKVDRATMAYSLEGRSPFLDFRVVDFANSLPTSFKFEGGNQKRILKDILYKHVPKEIFDRPKAGFTMPFKEWFRNDMKEFVLDKLSHENLKNIPGIDIDKVQNTIGQHMDGTWNHYSFIWKLLVLEQWLEKNGCGISIN
ncbi:MAG: asparagine synthase (glutamine-hydrolyzing) [Aurantibacter sp.]